MVWGNIARCRIRAVMCAVYGVGAISANGGSELLKVLFNFIIADSVGFALFHLQFCVLCCVAPRPLTLLSSHAALCRALLYFAESFPCLVVVFLLIPCGSLSRNRFAFACNSVSSAVSLHTFVLHLRLVLRCVVPRCVLLFVRVFPCLVFVFPLLPCACLARTSCVGMQWQWQWQ